MGNSVPASSPCSFSDSGVGDNLDSEETSLPAMDLSAIMKAGLLKVMAHHFKPDLRSIYCLFQTLPLLFPLDSKDATEVAIAYPKFAPYFTPKPTLRSGDTNKSSL